MESSTNFLIEGPIYRAISFLIWSLRPQWPAGDPESKAPRGIRIQVRIKIVAHRDINIFPVPLLGYYAVVATK